MNASRRSKPKRKGPPARVAAKREGLRMKDLIRQTGLSRQTIHFYVAQGLVPAGRKTSRTTSEYNQAHVDRLKQIRRLREEQLLPLGAVKGLLANDNDGRMTGRQRLFLRRATTAFGSALVEEHDVPLTQVPMKPLNRRDLRVLEESGLIEIRRVGRQRVVSADDAQIIEVMGHLREAGFTRKRGYTGAELVVFASAMARLVEDEFGLGSNRLVEEPPEVLREIAQRANPFLEHLMVVMRRKELRRGWAAAESATDETRGG